MFGLSFLYQDYYYQAPGPVDFALWLRVALEAVVRHLKTSRIVRQGIEVTAVLRERRRRYQIKVA